MRNHRTNSIAMNLAVGVALIDLLLIGPVVSRAILDQPDIDAAIDLLQTTNRGGGWNYLLIQGQRAVNVETTATRVVATPISAGGYAHTSREAGSKGKETLQEGGAIGAAEDFHLRRTAVALTSADNDIRVAITIDVARGYVDAEIEVRREGEEGILEGVSQAAGINSYQWSGAGTRAGNEIVCA